MKATVRKNGKAICTRVFFFFFNWREKKKKKCILADMG